MPGRLRIDGPALAMAAISPGAKKSADDIFSCANFRRLLGLKGVISANLDMA